MTHKAGKRFARLTRSDCERRALRANPYAQAPLDPIGPDGVRPIDSVSTDQTLGAHR